MVKGFCMIVSINFSIEGYMTVNHSYFACHTFTASPRIQILMESSPGIVTHLLSSVYVQLLKMCWDWKGFDSYTRERSRNYSYVLNCTGTELNIQIPATHKTLLT